ncbi:MAG: hypothetical protein M0D57_06725 [Sphingobacteriales bacterium JAD_PAG50586_3]|nr:MAG: hypothetical protein M0D57_06725 [Sphingobacteriales bacterium JAD_PAG50586_3]
MKWACTVIFSVFIVGLNAQSGNIVRGFVYDKRIASIQLDAIQEIKPVKMTRKIKKQYMVAVFHGSKGLYRQSKRRKSKKISQLAN